MKENVRKFKTKQKWNRGLIEFINCTNRMMIICRLDFCILVSTFCSLLINFRSCNLHRIKCWFDSFDAVVRFLQIFIFKISSQLVQTNTKIPPELSSHNTKATPMTDVYKRIGMFKVYCHKWTNKIPMQMSRARTKNVSFATFPFELWFFLSTLLIRFISCLVRCVLLFAQFLTSSPITRNYWLHISDLVLFVDCFITNQPFDSALYLCILKRWILKEKKSNYRVQSHEILLMRILFVLGRCYRAL